MAGLRRVKESIRGGVELCKGGRQEVKKVKFTEKRGVR
jgi:hypothetical protein